MFTQHLLDLGQDIPELVRCRFIPQFEGVMKPDLITHSKIFKAHHCELAIWNRHNGSLERPDPGRAEADILNGAAMVTCPAKVAHADGLIRDDHDPAE